ncbi:MAG: PHB depolymerase family esterase [Spirochaetota bacterium]
MKCKVFTFLPIFLLQSCLSSITDTKQAPVHFAELNSQTKPLPYILYLPPNYKKSQQKWPLLLFLHGAGERGNDLSLIKRHGPPKLIQNGNFSYPFLVLAPQCPQKSWWPKHSKTLAQLVRTISKTYSVDKRRIYASGLSMGGFGTWSLAVEYPDLFAAFAPICGGGEMKNACVAKNEPIWAFHGEDDPVISVKESKQMVSKIKSCGSTSIRLTLYPKTKHNSWTQTYKNPQLYQWLLQQKNSE